jgi:hypothetical protein
MGKNPPVHAGWVYASAQHLLKHSENLELGMAVIHDVPKLEIIDIRGVKHYLIPASAKGSVSKWKAVLEDFNAEVIHVHGTEYPYLYDFLAARRHEKVVLSIQGLVSVIERYYYGGIGFRELLCNVTSRDLALWDSLFHQRITCKDAVLRKLGLLGR